MTGPFENYNEMARGQEGGARAPQSLLAFSPPIELARQYLWAEDAGRGGRRRYGFQGLWNRRKGLMCSVSLLIAGAISVLVWLSPRKYEAELKLFVRRERVEALVTAGGGAPGPRLEVSESDVSSEIELFKSRTLLEKAVERCGLLPAGGSTQVDKRRLVAQAVQDLGNDLRVNPIKKTNLISVKYTANDPDRGAGVLNTIADLYLEQHSAVHHSPELSNFFAGQAEHYRQALVDSRKKLSAFQQRQEVSLLDQQKQATLGRLTELEAGFQESESQIQDGQQKIALLRQQLETLPATIQSQRRTARNEPLMEKLKSLLLDLENKRTELLTKYDPSYRLVQEVEKQIRDTRATIEREQTAAVVDQTQAINPLRQSIEAELLRTESQIAGLWARRASLAKDINYYRQRQQNLEKITAEHDDLQQQVKVAEENHLLYQKKQEESRMADAMDQQKILKVAVVEQATPPVLPLDRYQPLMLLLGVVVAVFAGFGSGLLAERLNRSIRDVAELISYTSLPVLATISKGKVACSYTISE